MGAAARSPLTIVILEIIVGALVSNGVIQADHKDEFVGLLADVIGAVMYVITALYALRRFFDYKKHHVTKEVELHKSLPEQSYSGMPDDMLRETTASRPLPPMHPTETMVPPPDSIASQTEQEFETITSYNREIGQIK